MPALAQFLLNLRKALSNVSFSLTITFDIDSHLTSLQSYIVHHTTVRVYLLHYIRLYHIFLLRQYFFGIYCSFFLSFFFLTTVYTGSPTSMMMILPTDSTVDCRPDMNSWLMMTYTPLTTAIIGTIGYNGTL